MTTRINQFNIANTATPELAELTVTGNVSANYFTGNGSQLTGISTTTSEIFNGASNVSIDSANSDITISVAGVGNVMVISTDGVTVQGNITGNGIPTTTVSNVAPTNPAQGDIWIDSDSAIQYIYFSDGDSAQWAEMEAALSLTAPTDLGAVSQDIVPAANVTYDLGTVTNRWRDIYLAGNTIYLGSAEISTDSGNLLLPDVVQIGNTVLDATSGNLTLPENISTVSISATGNITGGNVSATGNIFINGTPLTRSLTVGRRTTPVTIALATNGSFEVVGRAGNVEILTT
jgi:hypothetical protein